jgi:hypothetical protein
MVRWTIRFLMLFVVIAMSWSFASPSVAQPANAASNAPSNPPSLKPEELDQLVAPIALYPDNLLSEVLMASTYPLEIIQADRWINQYKDLKGAALKAAVDKQTWDDSVKSLVATPAVVDMMSSKIDWTQKLGNAVIAQQADVMDAVQRLRAKAEANDKLKTTKEQTVTVSQNQGRRVIAIAPADPETMYVPYYDPGVVYGPWPYPAYPPYYWPPPGYIAGGIIAAGIGFGLGYALGAWGGGGYWGGSVNWNNNNINISRPGGGGGNWNRGAHVEHRLGNRGGRQQGLDFRGNNGQRVLNPGNRGNAGNRVSQRPAGRPGAGNRGGRNHAATRPSRGGGRAHAATRPSRGGGGGLRAHRGGGGGGGLRGRGGGGGGGRAVARGGGGRGGGGGGRGGGGRGGGGRRSDIRLKHDIVYLGRLDDGLGYYRFSYNGSDKAYAGVMAQDVQMVMPQAVSTGRDGYLRVDYRKLGLKFESYDVWMRSGALLPSTARVAP